MTEPVRRKLIEVSIPLEAINKASAREKDIKVGKHTSIHQWFAPRPLATCRAVLFAQLVDDPSSWPDRFPTEAAQEVERKRLHKVIERLVQWEASNDKDVLDEARWEIARSVAWGLGEEPPPARDGAAILAYLQAKAPPVYDPFSGGGSIPLEAQRLGLRAYGSDLNPVAVLIGKALVEIPPKFAGLPPVNPGSRTQAARGGAWQGRGAQGLAEDVRYYGAWMRDEAARRIGRLYPEATLPDGNKATVIAWLWARTVRSPDPAAKGAMVPLVSSFLLATKEGKKAWVEPVLDVTAPDGYRFAVRSGVLAKADEERLAKGTKSAKGAAFVCVLTGATIARDYVQIEGKANRLGERLMAIVAEGSRKRIYLPPNVQQEALAASAKNEAAVAEARESFLSSATPTRAMITGGVCSAYGLRTWGHLFTPRQLVALIAFSDLVAEAREKVAADARAADLPQDPNPLHASGEGAEAYADAIATYLCFVIDKNTQTLNSLVRWFPQGEKAQPAFERQAIPMSWDFAEANPFGGSTGSIANCIKYVTMTLERWGATNFGKIEQISAQKLSIEGPAVICTDPPYYDNIGYAYLSDFFYVWLRRSIAKIWPDYFRRVLSPKDEEIVANTYQRDGKAGADAFFMQEMGKALLAMRRAATHFAPLTIFYAYKQSTTGHEGLASAGWASFLQSVVNSGLSLDGTWPMRTEHSSKMISQGGANILASSIVLVCRKRPADAPTATRPDFLHALRHELPAAIDEIRKAGVGPVDMQQSVIGPGMGVFTRYARVLEDDDSTMGVKTALALINRVWEEIENELDAVFDPATQVALAWFATYGFEPKPSGELIVLATAKDISLDALFSSGVFHDLRGRAGLIPRSDLPTDWSPATDKQVTVWECVQHTARALNAEDGGAAAAAALVAQMGPKADDARALAYRLFEIASHKGWAAEALVYNELAQEWRNLEDLASGVGAQKSAAAAQMNLL
jgi:putative DNA methylase